MPACVSAKAAAAACLLLLLLLCRGRDGQGLCNHTVVPQPDGNKQPHTTLGSSIATGVQHPAATCGRAAQKVCKNDRQLLRAAEQPHDHCAALGAATQ
jgi:hypothetical protein